ncbi:MAG TPA: protein kinase [Planctomycetota bacterium]
MTLAPGSSLSHYSILGPLGAGAMGEVYRARDTKLGREVAIKVLPEHFAADEERLRRFEREAKTLASLNHPNVAQIHGVDQVGETCFLVLELVPGESLEERLKRGPLPLDEALDVCKQIAEGLEAAHEAGVIHRDLKPANVRLTPDGKVKVLDFGLAKPIRDERRSSTDSVLSTEAGRLLGTPTYMAPEQARGRPIDARVDIWALGCVLYECLTGRRAFDGESLSDVLAAVLAQEPDWTRLPAPTPARLRELLARCLAKDPRERWRHAGDVRLELGSAGREAPARSGGPARPARRAGPVVLAFVAGALAAAVVLALLRPERASAPAGAGRVRRFALANIGLPIDAFQGLALSPDGRRMVYRGFAEGGREKLHVRELDALEPRVIEDSEAGWLPFFSPDGEHVGFYGQQKLRVATLASGTVRSLADLERGFSGAAWLPDDTLWFCGNASPLLGRAHARGGEVEYLPLTGLDEGDAVLAPWPLPGGKALLCSLSNGSGFDVAVIDLAQRSVRVVQENGFTPTWASSGHVLYQQGTDGPLMALPFDPERCVAVGPAAPVVTDLGTRVSSQARMFALAQDGTLAYIPRNVLLDRGALLWVDRSGTATPVLDLEKAIDLPLLSHDNRRIAFRAPAPQCEIWVHDLERGVTSRLTREGDNHGLAWAPDDARIAFARFEPTGWRVVSAAVDGAGEVEPHSPAELARGFVSSWSPDGRHVLVNTSSDTTQLDVQLVALEEGTVTPLLRSRHSERAAVFSPDGRHIAYTSDEEGAEEVYVQPFPALGRREKLSTGGGAEPVWSPKGDELFFRAGRKVMVVPVRLEPDFSAGRPELLFETDLSGRGTAGIRGFDVSADGQRFLMVRERSASGGSELHVVLGVFEELLRLAPRSVAR